MKFKTCTPCRLPLKHLDWERLVPWIGAAREALARFDESLKTLSFHDMETMISEESIASLRGQNIQASLKEVLQFAKDRSAEENRFTLLQKIVNAQKGLKFAIQWAKRKNPIGLPFFCKVHAIVKQDAPNPKEIGKLRKRQNWIGVQGCKIEEAYLPEGAAGDNDRSTETD